MGANRRRRRSVRMLVAAALLVGAAAVVAVSVGTGSLPGAAAVVALVSGVAATRIVSTELAQARRHAARDRAEQARAHRQLDARRIAEQARLATRLTARLTERDAAIVGLQGALRTALCRAHHADQRAGSEALRVAALEQQVGALRVELAATAAAVGPAPGDAHPDQLASWDAAQVPGVVDLVDWDQAAARAGDDPADPAAERCRLQA